MSATETELGTDEQWERITANLARQAERKRYGRLQEETQRIIREAHHILAAHNPMTVRQVYYQLVVGHVVANAQSEYKRVSGALVEGRKRGIIPWEWIEDRLRQVNGRDGWGDGGEQSFADVLTDFHRWAAQTAASASLPSFDGFVSAHQPSYVELWVEKDALSGFFDEAANRHLVRYNVGRGYDGWSSIREAADRFREAAERGKQTVILYFGDHDPAGKGMSVSLRERLGELGAFPDVEECAVTLDDIARYDLPTDFAKQSDSRTSAYVAKYGRDTVELDALPPDVLRERIRESILARYDQAAADEARRRSWERGRRWATAMAPIEQRIREAVQAVVDTEPIFGHVRENIARAERGEEPLPSPSFEEFMATHEGR